jgi:hypothetical protein
METHSYHYYIIDLTVLTLDGKVIKQARQLLPKSAKNNPPLVSGNIGWHDESADSIVNYQLNNPPHNGSFSGEYELIVVTTNYKAKREADKALHDEIDGVLKKHGAIGAVGTVHPNLALLFSIPLERFVKKEVQKVQVECMVREYSQDYLHLK